MTILFHIIEFLALIILIIFSLFVVSTVGVIVFGIVAMIKKAYRNIRERII